MFMNRIGTSQTRLYNISSKKLPGFYSNQPLQKASMHYHCTWGELLRLEYTEVY